MAIEYTTTNVPMDWEPSFMTTELLAQTGFGLCSGDHLPMAMSLSTMDQVQCEDNEPMDWQPQSPTDTGLVITPHLTSPTFYYLFHMNMIARLSAAFIIHSFPPPQPLNQEAANLSYPKLVFFVDSIIHFTNLPNILLFGALFLLHHLTCP